MLETTILTNRATVGAPEAPNPQIRVVEAGEEYGRFAVEPLGRGYAITLGNAMRRVLLSSMPGSAITWVKIDEVLHEYASLPRIKEEVTDFLFNIKRVRIRSESGRAGKMRLEIAGEGRVCAGDIATSGDFEIVNPELHLATLDSDDATLSVELNVERGSGYVPAMQGDGLPGLPIGVLPVDAVFNPIRKVNYVTERTRVGNVTDFERLVLEVWTDGTISPAEAVRKSAEELVNHFFLLSNLGRAPQSREERSSLSIPPEVYQTPIEKLELSPRTLNCLKRAHISKVGQVMETPDEELLKIRNFGDKSLQELKAKLESLGVDGAPSPQAPELSAGREAIQERDMGETLRQGPAGGLAESLEEDEEEEDEEEELFEEEEEEEAEEAEEQKQEEEEAEEDDPFGGQRDRGYLEEDDEEDPFKEEWEEEEE